jgi:tryptophan-rich sensory protein
MTVLASRAQLRASFFRWALFFVPVVLLLGYVSAKISGSTADNPWFASLVKPGLYPPPATFGIAWTILYILMGIAAALVAAAWGARGRTTALVMFAVQLVLNLAWSPVFFGMHRIQAALYLIGVMDVLVLVTVALFWRVRWQAGALLLPYLAWICFATYLSWDILQLNPDADGSGYSGAVQRIEL